MSAQASTGSRRLRTALAFGVPLVVLGFLALEEGGLDLVVRQQVSLAAWWLLALGLAFDLVPRAHPPPGWRLAAGGLLGLGALQLASVAWGPSDDRAFADACRAFGHLGLLCLAWGLLGPRSWRFAAAGLFAAAAAVTVYALLGRLAPDLPGVAGQVDSGRLAEPLGYWNALSAWAAMTIVMALAWSADERSDRIRALALAVIPLAGTVVYLTYSRGGVVAGAVGIGIVLGAGRNRRRAAVHAGVATLATAACVLVVRSYPEIADGTGTDGAVVVGLAALLAACGCWAFAGVISTRLHGVRAGAPRPRLAQVAAGTLAVGLAAAALIAGGDGFGRGGDAAEFVDSDPSARLTTAAGDRSAYWPEALDGFAAQPLRGEGAGSFGYRWASEGSGELVADPHSLPFATASELGLLGLVALAAFLIGTVLVVRRGAVAASSNARAAGLAAAAGTFAVSVAVDWTWESTAVAALGLGCVGVLAMAASRPIARTAPPARWALFAIAILLGAVQIPGVVAAGFIEESRAGRQLGDARAAVEDADAAIEAAPWSGIGYATRAEARLAAGDATGAGADALAAIEREPEEASHRILLAHVETARGDLPAAVVALRAAVWLSPRAPALGSRDVGRIGAELRRAGFSPREVLGGVPE
jgi:hypothetical protein